MGRRVELTSDGICADDKLAFVQGLIVGALWKQRQYKGSISEAKAISVGVIETLVEHGIITEGWSKDNGTPKQPSN